MQAIAQDRHRDSPDHGDGPRASLARWWTGGLWDLGDGQRDQAGVGGRRVIGWGGQAGQEAGPGSGLMPR